LAGELYLIATPIGNLEDITLRALRILREEVALIACEDTRQTQKLLAHYGIRKPLVSYHEHNEATRSAELMSTLERGESVALVSDAGTPLLSDPGYRLVTAAVEHNIRVVPIPGASALLPALTASALPTDSFLFVGFLPAKNAAKKSKLEEFRQQSATVIAYESPHRLRETLQSIAEVLGERDMVVARELTKLHEEFLRGTAQDILQQLEDRPSIKGEITLVIGKRKKTAVEGDAGEEVEQLERQGLARMDAIKNVAKKMGLPKREVYRAVAVRDNSQPGSSHDSDHKRR